MVNLVSVRENPCVYDTGVGGTGSVIAAIAIPIVVTGVGSYLITKKAYPHDFSLFKWIGVPVAIAVVGMASTFLAGIALSRSN